MLYQGRPQQTSWFAHKREGFGPPLVDSGLDAVRTYGIDEQALQRHAGVRGPEPPPSVQQAAPFHVDLWLDGRWQHDQAYEMIKDGQDEACLVDPQHGLTMPYSHLPRGLEWCEMRVGVPARPVAFGQVRTGVARRLTSGGHPGHLTRAKPATGHVIPELSPHQRGRQRLPSVGPEPGRTGAGLDPFNPWVVCAEGADPA